MSMLVLAISGFDFVLSLLWIEYASTALRKTTWTIFYRYRRRLLKRPGRWENLTANCTIMRRLSKQRTLETPLPSRWNSICVFFLVVPWKQFPIQPFPLMTCSPPPPPPPLQQTERRQRLLFSKIKQQFRHKLLPNEHHRGPCSLQFAQRLAAPCEYCARARSSLEHSGTHAHLPTSTRHPFTNLSSYYCSWPSNSLVALHYKVTEGAQFRMQFI